MVRHCGILSSPHHYVGQLIKRLLDLAPIIWVPNRFMSALGYRTPAEVGGIVDLGQGLDLPHPHVIF